MKKAIQVIATFLVIIFIAGSFILWPQIEVYLFGEPDEYIIIENSHQSTANTKYTDSIFIFSEKDWNKIKYEDLLMDLDIHKGEKLISVDEYNILTNNLEAAYINTLKNSIKKWTNNNCIDNSINSIQEEISSIIESDSTYKNDLEEEIEIINTYNEITNNFSDNINHLTIMKYDASKVRGYKLLISKYKRNRNFNKCAKVINIVKNAEKTIQNYELYCKEFNRNIIYYIENYKVEKSCDAQHSYSCTDYIDRYGKAAHEEHYFKKYTLRTLDANTPYKFDYTSNGDPLRCFDFENYTYYYNELTTKKSVLKRILFFFFLTLLTISANAERTDVMSSNASKGDTTIYVYDTITIYTNVRAVLNTYKKEIRDLNKAIKKLEQINKSSDNRNSKLKELNTNYSQSISQLITQVSNAINHIISLPTNETSLNTINSVLTIANNLSLLDETKQLEKYKEEFQIVYSANDLLHNAYNREENKTSINQLKGLQLSDNKRNAEKNKILSLLEKYCGITNRIASLFTTVAALSDDADKEKQLYKGAYYRYTKGYPFLYQELEKKKDNLKYKSPVKKVNCK